MKKTDFTKGNITSSLLLFALPMIAGNMLQQIYSIADTLIVGRAVGADALAAVGSTYTLMVFLNSLIIGFCMGNGNLFSKSLGEKNIQALQKDIWHSFWIVAAVTASVTLTVYGNTDRILVFLHTPQEIYGMAETYAKILFTGIGFVALYNYGAYLLRSFGNSMTPLCFLGVSSALNILLDFYFILRLHRGVEGAATATVISQGVSGIGIVLYCLIRVPEVRIPSESRTADFQRAAAIVRYDLLTGLQQSVMNFGILMIQGLVNSFGTMIMAAFTVAVKIDTLAYMPAQEFGNAFSLFLSRNYGAKEEKRISEGSRKSFLLTAVFCIAISGIVCLFAGNLMRIFVRSEETEVIAQGIRYLRIEGACYLGIGWLFLFYGYFRAVGKPEISLILTVISLGTRVAISYLFARTSPFGVLVIWASIPTGWFLADVAGILFKRRREKTVFKIL